jgi:hypothetical protein
MKERMNEKKKKKPESALVSRDSILWRTIEGEGNMRFLKASTHQVNHSFLLGLSL